MQVRFTMGVSIPGARNWDKGEVVESSQVPGGYLASWLRSKIVVPVDSVAPVAAATHEAPPLPSPPNEEHHQ